MRELYYFIIAESSEKFPNEKRKYYFVAKHFLHRSNNFNSWKANGRKKTFPEDIILCSDMVPVQ